MNEQARVCLETSFISYLSTASDEVLDELHAFREAYAAQFDYDIDRMFARSGKTGESNPARQAIIEPKQISTLIPSALDKN